MSKSAAICGDADYFWNSPNPKIGWLAALNNLLSSTRPQLTILDTSVINHTGSHLYSSLGKN